MLLGVCSGIAQKLDAEPSVIRTSWALLTIITAGAGLLAYFAAWLCMRNRG